MIFKLLKFLVKLKI